MLKLLHVVLYLLAKALRDFDEARVVRDARLGRCHGVLDGVDARLPMYGDWIGFLPDVWWYEAQ